jgi:transposase InsO family protein
VVERAPELTAKAPNDIWTIDFKGWWRATDGSRCDPLTVRDAYSRFVLALVLLPRTTGAEVQRVLTQLFRRYGVPKAIQCDNGSPFICVRSTAGLTRLSAWWVSLGIRIVRSRGGCPQDNGGHERMHLDIAADLQSVPEATTRLQQRACDRWRQEFNHVRPHDALQGKTPAELYKASPSRLRIRPLCYPPGWVVRRISDSGLFGSAENGTYVSKALAGYVVGLQPVEGLRYRAWFYDVDLGEIELAPTRSLIVRLAS